MGIKDVFDRIKGKPDPRGDRGKNKNAEAARRNTNEETVQVKLGDPSANSNSQQQDATVVAAPIHRPMPRARPPADAPQADRHEADATVVIPPSNATSAPRPAVAPTRPTPQAPSNTESDQTEATVVAPLSSAPIPQKPVATPAAPKPSSPSTTPVAQKSAPEAAEPSTPAPTATSTATPTQTPTSSKPVSSGDETLYVSPNAESGNEIAGVLVGLFGEAKGQVFTVPVGQCILGRAESCEIHVLDAKISREHAAISCVAGSVEIRALNERNPIIINDGNSAETQSVADGDKLQFGNPGASIFRFRTIDGL